MVQKEEKQVHKGKTNAGLKLTVVMTPFWTGELNGMKSLNWRATLSIQNNRGPYFQKRQQLNND